MKKCNKCGRQNIDKAIYCANCGTKLDSISKMYSSSSSSSTPNPALDAIKKNIAEDSSTSSSQSTDNRPSKTKICCCYVPVILFVLVVILALFMNAYPESFSTTYEGDFEYLDTNGDDKLSFDEARQLDPYLSDSVIKPYFLEADKNDNGYLIGYEFDGFHSDVKYKSDSGSSSSSSSSSSKSGSSSSSKSGSSSSKSYSSSSSLNDKEFDSSSGGYVLTCPYCGSEAIYETEGHYKCAECGHSIYDPDDLELGYSEGYVEILAPISLTIN